MRAFPLLAGLALLAGVPTPAPATGLYVHFEGTAHENCFGCGVTSATFDGTFTGVVDGHAYVNAHMSMSYSPNNGTDSTTCLATGSASGALAVRDATSSFSRYFTWTRTFDTVVGTIRSGGNFTATYTIVSPIGNPCGGPVDVDVRGSGYEL